MTTFYRDAAGNYLGGFDGASPPIGAIEVPFPPSDGRMKWDLVNGGWSFTAGAIDIINTATANADLNSKALRAITAIDFNFIKNPLLYATLAEYRTAIRDLYKTLNGS
jgi:hypothetical protein